MKEIEEFLQAFSTARIQIGSRSLSYLEINKEYIVYEPPRKILYKNKEFLLAWAAFIAK
jgi:hypothetical protein